MVVFYFVVDVSAGVALIVNIAVFGQVGHDVGLRGLVNLPALHLLQHFVLAVLASCAEGGELLEYFFFRHFIIYYLRIYYLRIYYLRIYYLRIYYLRIYYLQFTDLLFTDLLFTIYNCQLPVEALTKRVFPNWSQREVMAVKPSVASNCKSSV